MWKIFNNLMDGHKAIRADTVIELEYRGGQWDPRVVEGWGGEGVLG